MNQINTRHNFLSQGTQKGIVVAIFSLAAFMLLPTVVTVKSGPNSLYSLILIASLIFFWGGWRNLDKWEKWLIVGWILFPVGIGLSLFNSHSLDAGIDAYSKYARFLGCIFIYLTIRKYDIELSKPLCWGLLLGCVVMGVFAFYQHNILDIERPGGVRHFSRFGLMAVATALLTITAVTTKITDRKYLILGIIALLIIFYAVVINHTRAAILSIPIFFIVTVGFYWRHLKHMGRLVIFFAAIGLLILFFYPQSIVYQQIAIGISELRAFFDDPVKNYFTSWGLRPHMAHVAFLIFLSAPVFGTGLGDYGADAQALMDNGQTYILDGWLMTSAHNILLNTLAETGVVGLAAMLFGVFIVPGIVYIHNWQNSKTDSRYSFFVLGGIAILICFFVFGMFHTWLNVSSAISTFIILNLVFLSGIRHYRCKNELL